jgi:xanthine dehydrogenase accessory factor
MFEIADRLLAAHDSGRTLVVATAIAIEGSAPRTVGTSMAFDGVAVIGSIAGGCVEGAVVEVCELVLADSQPRTVEFGVSDAMAFEVGLSCGGEVRIHVQPVDGDIVAALREVAAGRATSLEVCPEFTEVATLPSQFIIFGAMEFAAALSQAALALGYAVTVCDPRPLFLTEERFPGVERVIEWPPVYLARTTVERGTVIAVLSHDDRFDAELIALALASPASYVGAMGSRISHERRVIDLQERSVDAAAIARLRSPIGLDVGASTPAETAISILAEVLAARSGSTTRPLAQTVGAIHRRDRSETMG